MGKILLITILLLLGNFTKGMEPMHGGGVALPYPRELIGVSLYEGPFVGIPTAIGYITCGLTGSLLVSPLELVHYGFQGDSSQFPFFHKIGFGFFGRTGAYIMGLPFYCLKKTFYDAPIYLWDAIKEEDKSSNKTDLPDSASASPEI